jgi:hypothetical protein
MENHHKSKSHLFDAGLLDWKSSEIEIPSLQFLITGWKIVRNRNFIPPILDYWMKNRQKSKFHPFDAGLLDWKSSEIEIPSLQFLITGWKIVRNQNSIPPILDYWMENHHKSKSHPFNSWLLDEKSSEIEIPSLRCWITRLKIVRNRNSIPPILDYWMENHHKSKSHPFDAGLLDWKSSEIQIPSLQFLITGWKIVRNPNSIPPILDYWMENHHKSKSHRLDAGLLDWKSSEIQIPSLQFLITGWKIIINQSPIPSMLDYWIENRQKSKFHPSNSWLLDGKSS